MWLMSTPGMTQTKFTSLIRNQFNFDELTRSPTNKFDPGLMYEIRKRWDVYLPLVEDPDYGNAELLESLLVVLVRSNSIEAVKALFGFDLKLSVTQNADVLVECLSNGRQDMFNLYWSNIKVYDEELSVRKLLSERSPLKL